MYGLADVACIVSGEALYYFDPRGTHFVDPEQKGVRPVYTPTCKHQTLHPKTYTLHPQPSTLNPQP